MPEVPNPPWRTGLEFQPGENPLNSASLYSPKGWRSSAGRDSFEVDRLRFEKKGAALLCDSRIPVIARSNILIHCIIYSVVSRPTGDGYFKLNPDQ